MRHFRHEFEDHIVARRCAAGVCEDLALSPCENSCPLHMNIPRFLELLKRGAAGRRVRVGDHGQSAAGFDRTRVPASVRPTRCRRQTMDEPVNMREVHRFIADSILLSDRFEASGEAVRGVASWSRPGARSPWRARDRRV